VNENEREREWVNEWNESEWEWECESESERVREWEWVNVDWCEWECRYASFLKDVALEVINRAERREQQRKEIARLRATLKSVQKHQEYIRSQIGEFERYLQKCRENAAKKFKAKKRKQVKFTLKELHKKGIIIGEVGTP
jgi:hypothetical protein